MENNLPPNWAWTSMLNVIDYEGGSQPPKKNFIFEPRKGYVRLLQIRDFGNKPFPTYVPDTKRLKKAKADDLLIARYGGSSANNDSLGRVCSGLEGAYNVALTKLIFSRETLERDYVKYLFMGPWFKNKVSLNSRSCQTGFNRDDVIAIKFPIAPFNEQKRIVAKLEKLLTKVNDAKERLETIPKILKRFRQSVLAAACSGRLTADWREENINENALEIIKKMNALRSKPLQLSDAITDELSDLPPNWISTRLGYAYLDSRSGISKRRGETGNPTVVLRLADITDGRINSDQKRSILLTAEEIKKYQLSENDILIIRVNGSPDLCGRFVHIHHNNLGTYCDHFIKLKTAHNLINPKYLCYFADSQAARNYIRREMVSSAGQNTVSQGTISNIPLALPPTAEQNEIIRRIDTLFELADTIEDRHTKAKTFVDKLTQSILAKAFRGELVPQDPTDEPAEKLLERIKNGQHKSKLKQMIER